ncbi:hypothetical protein Lxx06010 [Leifsonia xyli subsp. xyli str. CTCB07]|uniref:MFS transporter n=1 Tax=Leifsonia xyli subsp. xyli (strain CTCB07) TaxID=281090 RepID=Q6AGD4_LEIXX|nr:hypothetical protein Lxx06010 [Leifsonia xyli subsp. xyli str. CTCB07]
MSPLLALPAIAHTAGAEGWAAIAIGQSLGGAAGVLVELGWGSPAPSASPARPAATSPRPTRPD